MRFSAVYRVGGSKSLPLFIPETGGGSRAKNRSFKLWCENAKGLDAYPALIRHFEDGFNPDLSWNMEYFLGTYGALKYYAWKYFEKMKQAELAGLYKEVFESWMESFKIKTGQDINQLEVRKKIASLLNSAHENEIKAVDVMRKCI